MDILDKITEKYGELGLLLTVALGLITGVAVVMAWLFLVIEVSILFGLLPPAALAYMIWSVKNGN